MPKQETEPFTHFWHKLSEDVDQALPNDILRSMSSAYLKKTLLQGQACLCLAVLDLFAVPTVQARPTVLAVPTVPARPNVLALDVLPLTRAAGPHAGTHCPC